MPNRDQDSAPGIVFLPLYGSLGWLRSGADAAFNTFEKGVRGDWPGKHRNGARIAAPIRIAIREIHRIAAKKRLRLPPSPASLARGDMICAS